MDDMSTETTTLYLVDNGACLCNDHISETARATGRDISGQEILALTPSMLETLGEIAYCEKCKQGVRELEAGNGR